MKDAKSMITLSAYLAEPRTDDAIVRYSNFIHPLDNTDDVGDDM